ncbi:DUF1833 family protein [Herbaspirillum sp. VT-16-41]|uniref:DUF1833 family protein n=1 Tax=Herbaspirillum sp. VT-16-41 TaxID=1953765 RepID=UPI000981E5B1|nr:DUF1833 family protein [Herbaspirillum sp. VT-16-41]ONN68137.1 hypothetical protein BTM36_01915 [Herbaspirillum sp. VT-16-41]
MTSANFLAGRQRVDDRSGILQFLALEHPSFSAPVYLVNDTRDWVSNGRTYTSYPFRFSYPQDSADEAPQAKIEIDNVGQDLVGELEALPPGAWLSATASIADRATPDVIDWSWKVPLVSISVTPALITGTLSVDWLLRQKAVRLVHDPSTSPGIF